MNEVYLNNESIYEDFDRDRVVSISIDNIDLDDYICSVITCCPNLTDLNLSNCFIPSFNIDLPIKNLYIKSCNFDDLSLINCCSLNTLFLIDCETIDLNYFNNYKNIYTLSLESTDILNPEVIIMFDCLEKIDICFSNILDISSFAFMNSLKYIMLDENQYEYNKKYYDELNGVTLMSQDGDIYE